MRQNLCPHGCGALHGAFMDVELYTARCLHGRGALHGAFMDVALYTERSKTVARPKRFWGPGQPKPQPFSAEPSF